MDASIGTAFAEEVQGRCFAGGLASLEKARSGPKMTRPMPGSSSTSMLPAGYRWTRSKRPLSVSCTNHGGELVKDLIIVICVGSFLHDLGDGLLQAKPVAVLIAVHVLALVAQPAKRVRDMRGVVAGVSGAEHDALLLHPSNGVTEPSRSRRFAMGAVPRKTQRAARFAAIERPRILISLSMVEAAEESPAMSASTMGFQVSSRWLVISSKTFWLSIGMEAGGSSVSCHHSSIARGRQWP